MNVDTIKNASKYSKVHLLFAKAFEYIQQTDLANAPVGKVAIGEGLVAIFSATPGKSKEISIAKFECHNKHIDIQLCISGVETTGWKPSEKCVLPNGVYNEEKDVQLFNDARDTFFQLTNEQFAIFFPEDIHAPMIGEAEIKKLVIKVKI